MLCSLVRCFLSRSYSADGLGLMTRRVSGLPLATLPLIVTLAGCHWLFAYHSPPADAAPDHARADAPPSDRPPPPQERGELSAPEASASDVKRDAPLCSIAGRPAGCDPVAATGCPAGVCYLIHGQGPSCVCPPGTGAALTPCRTGIDCLPGLVCAEKPTPVCRRLCTSQQGCAATERCEAILEFRGFGYCVN